MGKSVQWSFFLVTSLFPCCRIIPLRPPCVAGPVFALFFGFSVAPLVSAAVAIHELNQLLELAGDGSAHAAIRASAFIIELVLPAIPARPGWRFGPVSPFVPGPGKLTLAHVPSLLILLLQALLNVTEEVLFGSSVGLVHHAFSEVGLVDVVVVGEEAEPQRPLEAQLVVGGELGPLQLLVVVLHHLLERHLLAVFGR